MTEITVFDTGGLFYVIENRYIFLFHRGEARVSLESRNF